MGGLKEKVPEHPCIVCERPTTNPKVCSKACVDKLPKNVRKGPLPEKRKCVHERFLGFVTNYAYMPQYDGRRKAKDSSQIIDLLRYIDAPPQIEMFREFVASEGAKCWEWNSTVSHPCGYAIIWDYDRGRQITAHRVSWELFHGKQVPKKRVVVRKCGTPECTNPRHLACGNNSLVAERLRISRKHVRWGENNAHARLKDSDVELLEELWRKGDKKGIAEIAQERGMNPEYVRAVARGKGRKKRSFARVTYQ